jgi:hypothetical protein
MIVEKKSWYSPPFFSKKATLRLNSKKAREYWSTVPSGTSLHHLLA